MTLQVRNVRSYYFVHNDGLSRLRPVIMIHGKEVWQCAVKPRINGSDMYYLFLDPGKYIKLWRSRKGDLLYFVSEYYGDLFFNEEPRIWNIDVVLNGLHWEDDTIEDNYTKIKFTSPIFRFVSSLNHRAVSPVAYLIHDLFFIHGQPQGIHGQPQGFGQDSGQEGM